MRTKLEGINTLGLMDYYIEQNYAKEDVLVISWDAFDAQDEYETLLKDLEEMGYLPPAMLRHMDFVVLTMPEGAVPQILSKHHKSSIRLYFYSQGELIDENH